MKIKYKIDSDETFHRLNGITMFAVYLFYGTILNMFVFWLIGWIEEEI